MILVVRAGFCCIKVLSSPILWHSSADSIKKIESNGFSVIVFDQDSKSDHELVFKKWPSSKSYVFNGKWHEDFVARRKLKVGDIIGLY